MPPDCGHGNPSLTPEERWAYGFAHLPFGFQGSADRDTPEVGLKPGCDAMEVRIGNDLDVWTAVSIHPYHCN